MKKETVINYLGVELTVTGNYTEQEKEIRYDNDMCGNRAYPSEFELLKVETESGDDILGIFMDFQREDIIELVLINLEN